MIILRAVRPLALRAIDILYIILFVRVLLAWLPDVKLYAIRDLTYNITEPLLAPLRNVLHRSQALRASPIDLSWIALYILLAILRRFLFAL